MQASSRCGLGNGDLADDAEEAGSIAFGTAPTATSREFWGRPLRTQESPERPFPLFQSLARASVNAKLYPAVFRVIRKIAVPTDRGAMTCECIAVSGNLEIRAIVAPTDRGAT
jgi:hypothetical protein